MKSVALCYEGEPPAPVKTTRPVEAQAMYDHLITYAAAKRMMVNHDKTPMLVCGKVLQSKSLPNWI